MPMPGGKTLIDEVRETMFDWSSVETVLLDLDGTLLDLHFDTHFWTEHLPLRYAERSGIALAAAKAELAPRLKAREGSLAWYCVDHWTRELGIEIAEIKREVAYLIAPHPRVPEFLAALRALGKRVVLATNAHPKSLAIKLPRAGLTGHFDAILCAHALGAPKEQPRFWDLARTHEPFDGRRTLFIDDNLACLRTAKAAGIRFLYGVRRPSKGSCVRARSQNRGCSLGAPRACAGLTAARRPIPLPSFRP